MSIVPKPEEFLREALIVIGGALIAAFVLSRLPAVRDYITNGTKGGCSCGN